MRWVSHGRVCAGYCMAEYARGWGLRWCWHLLCRVQRQQRPTAAVAAAAPASHQESAACFCAVHLQWLLTIPSIEADDIQFLDFCEEGRRLARQLADQVQLNSCVGPAFLAAVGC